MQPTRATSRGTGQSLHYSAPPPPARVHRYRWRTVRPFFRRVLFGDSAQEVGSAGRFSPALQPCGSTVLQHRAQAELLSRPGRGRHRRDRSGAGHRQAGRAGSPVVTPQLSHQIAVDRQLAQLTPARGGTDGRRAVAAAAAARTWSHPEVAWAAQLSHGLPATVAQKPNHRLSSAC